MARRRTDDEIAARLHELLNQQTDLEHQLGGISEQLRRDIEALTGSNRDQRSPAGGHVELDHVLDLLGRLAVAPTESDAAEVVVGAARQLLPGTRGALCRGSELGNGMATVGVWDHDEQWNRPYRDDAAAASAPHTIANRTTAGPTGPAEVFPIRGFGLAMGELRVWNEDDSQSLAREERHGRGEFIARCAGLVLAGMHLQQCLRRTSLRDPMTGLYSRGYLLETSERELHRAQRHGGQLGLMMFDIDRFGPFNDHYGPENGDRMLQAIADYLLRYFRQSDIAARYSGERFAVVLPDAGTNDTLDRAIELRDAVRGISIDGGQITISGAVATYPEHGERVDDLIHAAEAGIIEARQHGGDRVEAGPAD